MKKLLFILFLSPFSLYAWQPQCGFIVQSSTSKIHLGSGSVGGLALISCAMVTSDLPNYDWLKKMCAQYKTSSYPVVLLESDRYKGECNALTNQKILVYSVGSQYWASKHSTPFSLSGDIPVVMKFPSEFLNAKN